MRIALYHGYELTGSGSNEYNRYLSRALACEGHEVHVWCREPSPDSIAHATRAIAWSAEGVPRELFTRNGDPTMRGFCLIHQLPSGAVRPVYLTDKQRHGVVKAFDELTDAELQEYHGLNVTVLREVLRQHPVDIVHANHMVWQPCVAAELDAPFVIFPHGSSIEYILRTDDRYLRHAGHALQRAKGVVSGSQEILDRIVGLYPDQRNAVLAKSAIVGVGADTGLFEPIEPRARRKAIDRLEIQHTGKHSRQVEDLWARLDRNEFDAVTDYHQAYDHNHPDADTAERLAGLPWEDGHFLIFVGALAAGKGLHGLIAALPNILARHPQTHLLVVGSGTYREVLEALVHAVSTGNQQLFSWLANNGFDLDPGHFAGPWSDVSSWPPACPALKDHVHFLGRLEHRYLRHVFPCADLALFPSLVREAYPLVLIESLSNGVLPVVSDFSGFADGLATLEPLLGSEWVDRMRLPVAMETRVSAMSARINALLDEPAALSGLKPRLRNLACEHFDWSIRARQMVDAYRTLLDL